jgi:hypothetical protein
MFVDMLPDVGTVSDSSHWTPIDGVEYIAPGNWRSHSGAIQ